MKIKTIGRWVIMGIMSLTIGLGVYMWNATSLLHTAIPMPLGYGGAVVLSGSMEPYLSIDDLIIIHKTDDYKKDDVVVFETGRIVVVHRIVDIDGDNVITKGDANNVADDPIKEKDIIGEVICFVPGVGGIVDIIKSPIGIISILAVSFLLLELSYRKDKQEGDKTIEDIKEEIRRLKEE